MAEEWTEARREHGALTIVVGHPLLMSGAAGARAEAAAAVARALGAAVEARVVLWDERLSSVEAQRALVAGGVKRRRRRDLVDRTAAALVLQSWLDAQRSSST